MKNIHISPFFSFIYIMQAEYQRSSSKAKLFDKY